MDPERDDSYRDNAPGGARAYACSGCGAWIKSLEHDGYCDRCNDPGSVVARPREWAGDIGGLVAVVIEHRLGEFTDAQIVGAARRAAHFALEWLGRDAGDVAA